MNTLSRASLFRATAGLLLFVALIVVVGALPPPVVTADWGPFQAVSAGQHHTCGLKTDGSIDCWGLNGTPGSYVYLGQSEDQPGPFVQVSAGMGHTCGVKTDGSIDCWGGNSNGMSTDQLGPFTQVSAGWLHTCGLRTDGSIDCWGGNSYGEAEDSIGPFTQVSAGMQHTCGLKLDGSLDCWGYNVVAQAEDRPGPFDQVVAGNAITCALKPDSSVVCWGFSPTGETMNRIGPITQISAGFYGICGLKPDGSVDCWGNTWWDATGGDQAGPFTQISAGTDHSCGLKADGDIFCWGRNDYRQLAPPSSITIVKNVVGVMPDSDWNFSFTGDLGNFNLTNVNSQRKFEYLAAGSYTIDETSIPGYGQSISCDSGATGSGSVTVELLPDENVVCTFTNTAEPCSITIVKTVVGTVPDIDWAFSGDLGDFELPALGSQTTFDNLAVGNYTVSEAGVPGYSQSFSCDSGESGTDGKYVSVSTGYVHTCGLKNDGSLDCWGWNDGGQAIDKAGPFTQASAGQYHTCGLKPDGSVECWGGNGNGQTIDQSGPFVQLTSGLEHNCGLRPDGSAYCWGYGGVKEVLGPFSQVNAGSSYHTCALKLDGSVDCWGRNTEGQAEDQTGPFTQISVGVYHSCGLKPDGAVDCWGTDNLGQATDQVGPFTQIVAGYQHTCGVKPDGSVDCWGWWNNPGQAADQTGPFTQLGAGGFHNCGVSPDGSVDCWGGNGYGQAMDQNGPFGPTAWISLQPGEDVTCFFTGESAINPPLASNDAYTTGEDQLLTVTVPGVLDNDTDADNDQLTAILVDDAAHGDLALNPDGSFTYLPAPNFNGADSFTYKANDGAVDSNVATVNIIVNPINDPPEADDVTAITDEDMAVGVILTAADIDTDAITFEIVAGPQHGALSGTAPNLTYTPAPNSFGVDTFTYRANDGTADSSLATVTVTVNPLNDAPQAWSHTFTVNEDETRVEAAPGFLFDAFDVDGDTLTAVKTQDVAHGTLVFGGDGSFTYSPSGNFNGMDSFRIKVFDGALYSNEATIWLDVLPVNDPPEADVLTATTDEDLAVDITLSAIDIDADMLAYVVVDLPQHGTLSGAPPSLSYTPALNYNGADGFTYQAYDGAAYSNVATVSLSVTPVNDSPVANDDTATTDEDVAVSVDVLANDSDPDVDDTLSVIAVSDPPHGTAVINGQEVVYTPDPDFNTPVEEFDSFTCTISDGQGVTTTAVVRVTVGSLNDLPVATADESVTPEDTVLTINVIANDYDVDDNLEVGTVNVISPAQHGTAVANGDGTITYLPGANYHGPDEFTYEICDSYPVCASAVVSVTVTSVNDLPVAVDQDITTGEDTPIAVILIATDDDGDGLSITLLDAPLHGTLSGAPPELIYTPDLDYNGPDSFTFKANDGIADSNVATVSMTVDPVNDPPLTNNVTATTDEDVAVVVNLNAIDIDSSSLTYSVMAGPSHGTLSGTAPTLTYTPAANYNGPDSFTYKVNDGAVDSNVATVDITVNAVNDAPVATWVQTPISPVLHGAAVYASFTYIDPDAGDSHICGWDWGDGTPVSEEPCVIGTTIPSNHVYASVGSYVVTVTVTDAAGASSTTEPGAVSVIYTFTGFFSPVNNPPVLNGSNAGSAIPIKFSLGGDFGLGILSTGYPKSVKITCDTASPTDEIELTDASGNSGLQYDPQTGQYKYVWKTEKAWGDTCRQFQLKLIDGTTYVANFKFK